MIKLSQRDPQWATVKLGKSSLTVGRYGCTTTCISMLTSYFGCYRTPPDIAKILQKYTPDGLVLWSTLDVPCMKFVGRIYTRMDSEIDASLKDPDKAVILNVANGSHWVVAIKRVPLTSTYLIADPWDGRVKLSTAYRNITGSAHYIRK